MGSEPAAAGRFDSAEGLETSVGGCEVRFDGTPAPLVSVGAFRIELQVPYSVAGQPQTSVEIRCGGNTVARLLAAVTSAAPALYPKVTHEDGSVNSADNPAARGSVVVFLATGEGQSDVPSVTGKRAQEPLPHPALPVNLTIANIPADLLYCGAAPGLLGVLQINARVPGGFVPPGPADAVLTVGTAVSGPVTLYLR
jgi:uncharacterized protein (TIGR03437 family)